MKKSKIRIEIEKIMNRKIKYFLDKRKNGYRLKIEGEATSEQLVELQKLPNVTKVKNIQCKFDSYIEYSRCQSPYKEVNYYPAICIYLSKKLSEC